MKQFMSTILLFIIFLSAFSYIVSANSEEIDTFILIEGNYVNLDMPEQNSVGVKFIEVLLENQATQVCDAGYALLHDIVGYTPYSGDVITITALGYDGEENKPVYAGWSGNPITVVYDRRSDKNYILSYTPDEGENSVPNFGLYFHEMWHDFTPPEFRYIFADTVYLEGFAHFSGDFISMLIINDAQVYGLSESTVNRMLSISEWSLSFSRTIDPERARARSLLSAFLHDVADDFQDYGKGVFSSFFTLLKEIDGLFSLQSEVERNSLLLAMIDTVTESDYRSSFEYYTFEINNSLYDNYIETLTSLYLTVREDFNFVAYGDTRSQDLPDAISPLHEEIVITYLQHDPEFIIHTGDIVLAGGLWNQWIEFNDSIAAVWDAGIPFYGAVGNHEKYTDQWYVYDEDFSTYRTYFDFTHVIDEPGENELYHSFNYGGIHFIFLNTEDYFDDRIDGSYEFECSTTQMNWLLADLTETNPSDFIVVAFHRTAWSIRADRPDRWQQAKTIRDAFHDIFVEKDVDLVLMGHDHLYYHTIRGGIHYITTGGGGAPLAGIDSAPPIWQEGDIAYDTYHYCHVEVNTTHIGVTAISLDDITLDSFIIARITPLYVSAELSSESVDFGEMLSVSALVKDDMDIPVEDATVTVTIGDLEVLFRCSDEQNGVYTTTINSSILEPGTHEIVVEAKKDGYKTSQTLETVTVYAIPLQATLQLSAIQITSGEELTLSVYIQDDDGEPVDGVDVKANVNGEILNFSNQGNGEYVAKYATSSLVAGSYDVIVTAQKTPGYQSVQASERISVTSPVPWFVYGGIAIIIIAVMVTVYLIKRK